MNARQRGGRRGCGVKYPASLEVSIELPSRAQEMSVSHIGLGCPAIATSIRAVSASACARALLTVGTSTARSPWR